MNYSEKKKWEKARARGLGRFVLIDGGLKLGLTFFIAISILGNFIFRRPFEVDALVEEGVICLIGGLSAGFIIWIINEMRH